MKCEICGSRIPELRLSAIPDTRMCLRCVDSRTRLLRPDDVADAMAVGSERAAEEILRIHGGGNE